MDVLLSRSFMQNFNVLLYSVFFLNLSKKETKYIVNESPDKSNGFFQNPKKNGTFIKKLPFSFFIFVDFTGGGCLLLPQGGQIQLLPQDSAETIQSGNGVHTDAMFHFAGFLLGHLRGDAQDRLKEET